MTGESTPSYLLHSSLVIPRLQAICPQGVKILVMLRNPVDRAYSHYQMCVDPTGTPEQLKNRGRSAYVGKTFEQVVEEEIVSLASHGIHVRTTTLLSMILFLFNTMPDLQYLYLMKLC